MATPKGPADVEVELTSVPVKEQPKGLHSERQEDF